VSSRTSSPAADSALCAASLVVGFVETGSHLEAIGLASVLVLSLAETLARLLGILRRGWARDRWRAVNCAALNGSSS
jgi:hypothetical protein